MTQYFLCMIVLDGSDVLIVLVVMMIGAHVHARAVGFYYSVVGCQKDGGGKGDAENGSQGPSSPSSSTSSRLLRVLWWSHGSRYTSNSYEW